MSESLSLDGKGAIVTGAGGGLGRAEALALAAAGAGVVVNDMGDAADTVVAEIQEAGGKAIAVQGDVSDWALGEQLVKTCHDEFGSMDIVVNNAGVLRDQLIFNLSEKDWDDVIRVHLKGHANLCHHASVYWRAKGKETGEPVNGRVINTSSEAFLFGAAGQPNYSAAKAGITALTLSVQQGMAKYGVTANVICPRARTAMTEHVFGDGPDAGSEALDIMAPERVATFVAYLASPAAQKVTGQVFVVYGDFVALMAAPTVENKFTSESGTFTTAELESQLTPYFADRSPWQTYSAFSVAKLDTTGVENKVANKKK